jgi:hypothetical protein
MGELRKKNLVISRFKKGSKIIKEYKVTWQDNASENSPEDDLMALARS